MRLRHGLAIGLAAALAEADELDRSLTAHHGGELG